jgi:hypothetical protein
LFGSRGPFMPLKIQKSIISAQGNQGGAVSSDGEPSTFLQMIVCCFSRQI